MAFDSFLYFNYFSSIQHFKPSLSLLPLTWTNKTISQDAELTAFRHSIVNFGNYVFVSPVRMSLSGVKFDVDYMIKKPSVFLQGLMESQKLAPLLYVDPDYNGAVFLNSYSVSNGNEDLLGNYNLNFTYYNIDLLNSLGKNDIQLSVNEVTANSTGSLPWTGGRG